MEEVQTSKAEVNKATSQSLLIMVSLNVAAWQSFVKMLADKQRRETEEIKEDEEETTNNAFTGKSETSNNDDLLDEELAEAHKHLTSNISLIVQSDLVMFVILQGMSQLELEDEVPDDLKRATGVRVYKGCR
ncbi:coatomer subunit beta-1-like protein [Trifolium pratense]|uniref:Coatomer subunit beta-1-like protein n=1 Tax=Trifolium pratense TaxID=57577 RepID=A0A2K3LM99_TRIPR|nr:coatomer subunit beta-1-like protein [Trifolium pratense]